MPAQPITTAPTPIACCDVVGKYAAQAAGFVEHLGLATASCPALVGGDTIEVFEMPVRERNHWAPAAHGSADLSYEEGRQIRQFCRQHKRQHESLKLVRGRRKLRGYVVRPHSKPFCEADGTEVALRFSCVGFVIEAYREANIDLVITEENMLPGVPWEMLSLAFPPLQCADWAKVNQEYDLGLDPAAAEWHVMLPGYAMNSLRRDHDAIRRSPYVPELKDARFS